RLRFDFGLGASAKTRGQSQCHATAGKTPGQCRQFLGVGRDIDLEKACVDSTTDGEVPLTETHSSVQKAHERNFHPEVHMLPKTSGSRAQVGIRFSSKSELGEIQQKID